MTRGHFPPVTRGGTKRHRKKGKVPTPRPTPQLLQSKAPSKLVPDLGHTGIQSSLGMPELLPCLPNARLNPNFVKLATRRAHEVGFDKVRVERKRDIAPLQNFTHQNHYDLMNKVMVDIQEEHARNAVKTQANYERAKGRAGFGDKFETVSEASITARSMVRKPKKGVHAVRAKKYFNTLGLFECLWDSIEPRDLSSSKYGNALAKKKAEADVFVRENGRTVVIPENWDPEVVFDAHFGVPVASDDLLAKPVPGADVIKGATTTITRQEIKAMSDARKTGFASPIRTLTNPLNSPPLRSLNQTI